MDNVANEGQETMFQFRLMTVADIPDVMEIEHEAFTLPWTEEAFHNELKHNHFAKYMVMELDGTAIGYAGMWTIMDEAHITNIAVRKAYQGRKLGEKLLDELMKTAYLPRYGANDTGSSGVECRGSEFVSEKRV